MLDLLENRLIGCFIVALTTGKTPASLRKLMKTAPEELVQSANDKARDIIFFFEMF
jgi:hypothetical protein